jgi:serine/threonine protein kinase
MSYEDGYPVFNSKDYSIAYICHSLGYYPKDINKQSTTTKNSKDWELPKSDIKDNILFSEYAKCIKTTDYNVKIYETKNITNIITLYNKLLNNKHHYETIIKEDFSKSFTNIQDKASETFIIKRIPCDNVRYMYAGFKEANMMYKIDLESSEKDVKLVPKVYFASPMYNKGKWYYIIVMEKINGILLKDLTRPFNKYLRYIPYKKQQILEATKNALEHLWSLGFSHNDLHDGNIMYDKINNRIIFLDCETVVIHTDEDINKYKQLSSKHSNVSAYVDAYKDSSVSLLHLASYYTISYVDKDNLIYNTDDWVLTMVDTKL